MPLTVRTLKRWLSLPAKSVLVIRGSSNFALCHVLQAEIVIQLLPLSYLWKCKAAIDLYHGLASWMHMRCTRRCALENDSDFPRYWVWCHDPVSNSKFKSVVFHSCQWIVTETEGWTDGPTLSQRSQVEKRTRMEAGKSRNCAFGTILMWSYLVRAACGPWACHRGCDDVYTLFELGVVSSVAIQAVMIPCLNWMWSLVLP